MISNKVTSNVVHSYRWRRQQGISKLTLLVFGVLVAALVYSAYHILPFYYYYYELQSHFEHAIRVASTEKDSEIRKRLMYHIEKYGLPVNPEDLKIDRSDRFMRISLKWQEVFYITWQGRDYDIHTFKFHAYAEGAF